MLEQQPPWPDPAEPPPLPGTADLVRRASRASWRAPGELTDRRLRRPGRVGRARRPAGPLPAGRHEPGQPRRRGGHQGPRGPRARAAAAGRAGPAGRPRRGARQPRVGRHASAASTSADVPARRRTPADPGQRHRQPALRRHPAGRHRPARPADPGAGRGGRCAWPTPRTCTTRCPAAGRACSTSAAAGCPAASDSGWCSRGRSPPDPEILVLVEPTSAVDAHTEARIAERRGRRPARPDDRGEHGLAALAAPRRPGRAARGRPGRPRRHPRGPAARQPGLPPRRRPGAMDATRGGGVRP